MMCQGFLGIDQRLGDGAQVVGDDAPADPALHAILAVIATALQLVPTFQPTDPSFDAGPPVAPTLKPALALVRLTCGRRATSLMQHNTSAPYCRAVCSFLCVATLRSPTSKEGARPN